MRILLTILLFSCLTTTCQVMTIDHARPGQTITLSGNLGDLVIRNLEGTADRHIKIGGKATAKSVIIENCEFVDIVFTGYGLTIANSTYRAVTISGIFSNNRLEGMNIIAPADYGIFANHNRKYDGTLRSINHSNIFRHIRFSKCRNNPMVVGFSPGFYWQYNRFSDIRADSNDVGTVLALEWNFDAEIDHCRFTNWGLTERGHTAAIYIRGNANVHDNYFRNGWGDGARFFGISLGDTGTVRFERNKFEDSRKYGACEVNTQPGDTLIPGIRPVRYVIANNIVGNIQASGYTDAAFDIYYGFLGVVLSGNRYKTTLWHNGNNGAKVTEFNNVLQSIFF